MVSPNDVMDALSRVTDPELHRDVVSLHMVQDLRVEGDKVSFTLNLTTPACPMRAQMEKKARAYVSTMWEARGNSECRPFQQA